MDLKPVAAKIFGSIHSAGGRFARFCKVHGAEVAKDVLAVAVGAMLAFGTERYFRDKESDQRNLEAGLLVLATLEDMQRTLFANYCINVQPKLPSKRSWLDLGANPTDFPSAQPLDTPSMSFLLPKAGISVYEQLNMARDAYTAYAELVTRRNRLLWEVIYPVTDRLTKERASRGFNQRVIDAIGSSPVEQAHQASLVMLDTSRYIHVVDDAESLILTAMRREFGDKVPQMPDLLWPVDTKDPDCSSVENDGTLGRVRPIPVTQEPDNDK
jgi:hypothetical protein